MMNTVVLFITTQSLKLFSGYFENYINRVWKAPLNKLLPESVGGSSSGSRYSGSVSIEKEN